MRKARKSKLNAHRQEYKRKRSEVNIMIRKAKSDYTRTLLSENSRNPDGFWAAVKCVFSSKAKSVKSENLLSSTGLSQPNLMKSLMVFVIIFHCRIDFKTDFISSDRFHMEEIIVSTITYLQIVSKLKRKKVAGNDILPPGLLKDSAAFISAPFTHNINLSFRSGVFPSDWKIAKILSLYKNGATDQFGNYCPILILFVISKVVEKIVHNWLVGYLSENKLLSKCQFGFRAKRSTELVVTLLCDDIRKNPDSKLLTGCVFIDFSKAFGTISHAKLFQKLNAYGIRNVEFDWFSNYLFNRKQLVNYNNTLFESSLPQESILGPLSFIIFVNDIVDVLRNSGIIKYANDTVLYVASNNIEIIESHLSDDLNLLAELFKENELILNLKKGKTEAMVFGQAFSHDQ